MKRRQNHEINHLTPLVLKTIRAAGKFAFNLGNTNARFRRWTWPICLGLQCLVQVQAQTRSDLDSQFEQLESAISTVPFLQPRLDFATWLKDHESQFDLDAKDLAQWQNTFAELRPTTGCEQLRHDNLRRHLDLIRNRARLIEELSEDARYEGRMSELPNGKKWYLHWLNSWLLLDFEQPLGPANIKHLKAIAKAELEKAHPNYLALSSSLSNRTEKGFSRSQHDDIVRAFKQREQQVNQNIEKTFGTLPKVPAVRIRPSNLPKSFPAPGIYNNENQTFYYHFTDQYLPSASLDWLYLHEAVPGHHFQSNVSRQMSFCPGSSLSPLPLVMAEGWAAYVETLGQQLGVFQQTESHHYALEWRVLRALRVLIDVGIHYEGWSDEQALALWRQYLPERMSIGRRELARIKRWPVQVISYVYGKHHIETLIQQLVAEHGTEHQASIRNTILRLSNQPPVSLQTASYFLTRNISK